MNVTFSFVGNPKSVTHVLGHFCYLSLRLFRRLPPASSTVRSRIDPGVALGAAIDSAGIGSLVWHSKRDRLFLGRDGWNHTWLRSRLHPGWLSV